jgi:hypothetical protein
VSRHLENGTRTSTSGHWQPLLSPTSTCAAGFDRLANDVPLAGSVAAGGALPACERFGHPRRPPGQDGWRHHVGGVRRTGSGRGCVDRRRRCAAGCRCWPSRP